MQILTTTVEETTTGTLVETAPVEAPPSTLDNILTLGMLAALAIVVIAAVIRKALANKKAAAAVEETPEAPAAELAADAPTAPGAAGEVKLHNVEPKIAAMLMAIVADKMGKPINELRFISIKEVE